MKRTLLMVVLSVLFSAQAQADWPMLHGNPQHTGFCEAELKPPFRLAWERHFTGERLGTAMEPIVADGRLFVATHSGYVYALDATSGTPQWRFAARGPFLHSPAVADGLVFAACTDGGLYALRSASGELAWRHEAGTGGFSASPVVADDAVFVGSRRGEFLALDAATGRLRWQQSLGIPIRQTAAVSQGRVFVTAEDLRVRCFAASDGKPQWTSAPLSGQTARDYYPIIVSVAGRPRVIVRTNPVLNFGRQISQDRALLARNAGADNSHWKKLDDWLKSDAARGNPELWAQEQRVVGEYLAANPDARTFFVLDAETGRETQTAPVLWVGGCQGVGVMPALTRDGRLLVFHRSAYGNWNHGVAPMVALALFDVAKNECTPLFHQQGRQPAWNCFWGTADESQNFDVAGDTVLIVHQGTLSGFDLSASKLFPICGDRDKYGGFRNPPWARNEWHGPARGGVAVVQRRLYWLTGSRVLCVIAGEAGKAAGETPVDGAAVPTRQTPRAAVAADGSLRAELARATREVLSAEWAPLFTDPGLAGRIFLFDESRTLFEALAWAWPHLPADLQQQARVRLAEQWQKHPPFAPSGNYALNAGEPREWFPVPPSFRTRLGTDPRPQPFGGVYAAWLYGTRCGEMPRVQAAWPAIKDSFASFVRSGWKLDAAKGDLYANRYLASLLAVTRLANQAGDADTEAQAQAMATETSAALVAWWRRVAEHGTLRQFQGVGELDRFLGTGDGLSFRVAPHRHQLALFQDLTPEVAERIRSQAPEARARVWQTFSVLYRTWPFQGEERQVHFGENFVDPPDLALGAFAALAWLMSADAGELTRHVDLSWCRADLCYVTKLAVALQAVQRTGEYPSRRKPN
jgi:hypothetical protein